MTKMKDEKDKEDVKVLQKLRERAKMLLAAQHDSNQEAVETAVKDFLLYLWSIITTARTYTPTFLLILHQFKVELTNGRGAWVSRALNNKAIAQDSIIRILSEGRIGDAFQLTLALIRLHLNIFLVGGDSFLPKRAYRPNVDLEYEISAASRHIEGLFKPAYEMALAEKRFGVALALYRQNWVAGYNYNPLVSSYQNPPIEVFESVRSQLDAKGYSERHRKALGYIQNDPFESKGLAPFSVEDKADWRANRDDWKKAFWEVRDLLRIANFDYCRRIEIELVQAAELAFQLPKLELVPSFICPCFFPHTLEGPNPLKTAEDLKTERKAELERILAKYYKPEYAVAQYYRIGDTVSSGFKFFESIEEAVVSVSEHLKNKFPENRVETWQAKRLKVTYVASLQPDDKAGMQLHEYLQKPFKRLGALRHHAKIYIVPRHKIPAFFGISYKPEKK